MELYKITKSDYNDSFRYARIVSLITGKSYFYHCVDCLYCIVRYGCSPKQYYEGCFYRLRAYERDKTYTKYRGYKAKKMFCNANFEHICANKVDFNRFFPDYIKRNWIYCKEASFEEIVNFLSSNKKIIAKPFNLTKGKGIYELDRRKSNEELANSVVQKDILLEEIIVQHPKLYFDNKSVNSIRINTILDSQGEVHILKAAIRCGVGDSIVDNYSAGGVVYPINLQYGRIEGPGVGKSFTQTIYVHPGTSFFMVGLGIPYWKETLEMVISAAKALSQVRFVGWDIAITEEGPVLIEGNTRPGASLIENIGNERGFWKRIISYK